MKAFITTAVLAATIFGASIAQAAVGVSLKVGTLGVGADVTVGIAPWLNARVGYNMFSYGTDFAGGNKEEDGVGKITPELKLQSLGGLLDVHPWSGGFRISAGCYINSNKLDMTADTTQMVEINGQNYMLGDLQGTAEFKVLSPYVGIGYGNAAGSNGRWHFSFDLGALFQGSPDIKMHATISNPALQAQLDADLEEEARKIEEDVKIYTVYPVLSMGVSFRF